MSDAEREQEIRERLAAANDETDDFITHLAQGQLERNARHDVAWLLARLDAERAHGWALYQAFVKHRTATHEVEPYRCKTCRESEAAMTAYLAASSTGAGGAGDVLVE